MSSVRDRLEAALARIADPSGEGARAFLKVYADEARAAADAADARARFGHRLSPLDGKLVSLKDLFDVAGEPTTGGSLVYRDAAPAEADAPVVRRLRAAGAVIVGKTNMTEFAFSGVGINPHYGTPGNPADRARIPGGSSAGAAVAVADGMCDIAIGSDTGGSVRIPAALCGIMGFKPTQARVPRDGVMPLSLTADTIGPLAKSVADLAAADAVMAGEAPRALAPRDVAGLRLAVPRASRLFDKLDATVAAAFERALSVLAARGAHIVEFDMADLFACLDAINAIGLISAVEAAWRHKQVLATRAADIDRRVVARIGLAAKTGGADYVAMIEMRKDLVRAAEAAFAPYDAIVSPTVAVVAPRIAELEADDAVFTERNLLILRNTTPFNMFDSPGLTAPIHAAGELPAGLMLMAARGRDHEILNIGAGVERLFARA
jgi:aspartyl-tRNA(Asn)/glutamyl-tRNA(Gln) amidotransferase subunit A